MFVKYKWNCYNIHFVKKKIATKQIPQQNSNERQLKLYASGHIKIHVLSVI